MHVRKEIQKEKETFLAHAFLYEHTNVLHMQNMFVYWALYNCVVREQSQWLKAQMQAGHDFYAIEREGLPNTIA